MQKNKYNCPISKLLFKDPESAENGQINERPEIEKWLNRVTLVQ